MPSQRLLYLSGVSPFRRPKGTSSHTDGITVNKTTQTVESAAVGGVFHIEDVYPLIDGGRFPVKRIAGERVEVWADIYRDGHDVVSAALVWRREREREWRREPMTHHSNDRWGGSFVPDQPGRYVYALEAWTDEFATWRRGFELKQKAGADVTLDAIEGAGMLTKALAGGQAATTVILKRCEDFLQTGEPAPLLSDELKHAMAVTMRCTPNLARCRIFAISSPPASSTRWKSRSISPCNARPTIRGSSSIRNGSGGVRTDRCGMRKTRPRNTRTSSTRIFHPKMPARCGMRCAMSCCSGSIRASTYSGSTIPTPSHFASGNG